jgi:hypothetical protein
MPQQYAQEASTTFVKGLITEATELTFPKDASVDELNCTLERTGKRRRRLGIEYETGFELTDETYVDGLPVRTLSWVNVGGQANLEYAVVQVGNIVRFFNKGETPVSANPIPISDVDSDPYTIDLTTYNSPGGSGSGTAFIQVASIQGALVVVSPEIEAFYITRDNTTGVFTEYLINHRIRDFEWLGNRAGYISDVDEDDIDDLRIYDTLNSGWTYTETDISTSLPDRREFGTIAGLFLPTVGGSNSNALGSYVSSQSKYPALTHPWFSGKYANDTFSVTEWRKVYTGNSLIGNGRFILDLFNLDRATASGIETLPSYINDGKRFSAVAAYAGRVFYSGLSNAKETSRVYFSQLLETLDYIGDCYQINDPTSEATPDLLDTDGGYINIPEAYNIKSFIVSGPFLLVMADNGVWSINGVDNDIFRATSYQVAKVTDYGIAFASSLINANGIPFWWSNFGIHTITPNQFGNLEEQSVSLSTIQSYWDSIGSQAKSTVVGEYDALNRKLLWLYSDNDGVIEYKYNKLLFLDTELGAFYPWTISDLLMDTPYIVGTSFFSGVGANEQEFNVIDSDGNQIVDSNGDNVIVTRIGLNLSSSTIRFLVKDPTGSLTFATFTNNSFYDWDSADYSSYAVAGHNFAGDITVMKNAPYITLILERTETSFVGNDESGYQFDRPSSILVTPFWDFKSTPATPSQQGYRLKDSPIPPDFSIPYSAIQTRLKLRGRGRSVRIRFESEEGKDFSLLGYEVIYARNPKI